MRLPLAFIASGAAGLLFEVLWFRGLGRVLGNTVWAAALVLTAFMLGIALGGILAARWSERIRNPARGFAIAEATVALSGSLVVWGLPAAEIALSDWFASFAHDFTALASVRLVLALAAMLVPTMAMGTTLALGVRVWANRDTKKALGTLYAAHTFGACIAPLLAEYYLIEALGLRGTALAAASLNLVAAALVWPLAAAPAVAPPSAAAPALSPARLLLAAAAAGVLALGLEVIWFRLLILHVPATDKAFALMLALVLAGIALGGVLAPLLARLSLAWIAAANSAAVILGYVLAAPRPGAGPAQLLDYAAPLMLPAVVLSGCLFTRLGAELRANAGDPQPAIGRLSSANTLGAALGAALAGFVLLPWLGMEGSLFSLAAGYALLTFILAEPRVLPRTWAPAAFAAGVLLLFPFGLTQRHLERAAMLYQSLDGSKVLKVIEGPTTTLQIMRREHFGEPVAWRLLTDHFSMTAIDREGLRYMQLFAWLPAALHPQPERALLISYGAGNTAHALLATPGLKSLTVVDPSPEILAASRFIHGRDDPLADRRVHLALEDGRQYLRNRREQFDLITSEPPPPMMAGVVNLYSREYFAALRERLAPGGLATYWLPRDQFEPAGRRAVVAAFCEAFRDCTLWAGTYREWILMGGREFAHRPSAAHIERLWREPASGPRLAASGFEQPAVLGASFLADAAQLRAWYGATPPVTDNHPKRIRAEPPFASAVEEDDRWAQPANAAARFAASSWAAAHWPAALLRETHAYFSIQPALDGRIRPDPAKNLLVVDALLRDTQLRIPVLWLLGSDVTEQMIVNRRLMAGYRIEYAYPLGVRALMERDYEHAANLLLSEARREPHRAGVVAAYALCRSGAGDRAKSTPGAELLAPPLRCWEG